MIDDPLPAFAPPGPLDSGAAPLLQVTPKGIYCAAGDFYIDPWRPVERAIITHAHSDHARPGSAHYLASPTGALVLRHRVQPGALIQQQPWGEAVSMGGVRVSLHPAGHILGSAQVRVEHAGRVWVVSGDYKTRPDATCEAFEPLRCDVFITECTFGLPVYRWPAEAQVASELHAWWAGNQALGRTSVVLAYALGKAQRVLGMLDAAQGPIGIHGALARFVEEYRAAGRPMPPVLDATVAGASELRGCGLVVAPPSAAASTWLRRFGDCSVAMASGWMQVRGVRRRQGVDRGFVLSDHADWPGLLEAIRATGASTVLATHGNTGPFVRYLREEMKLDAHALATQFRGEAVDDMPADEQHEPGAQAIDT